MKLQDGKKEKEKRREEKKSAAIFSAAKNQRADEKSKTHAQQKGNAREKFNFTNHSRVITWKMNFFFPPRRKLQMETRNGKVPELRGKQITGNLYVLIFVCISKKISILLCLLIKRKSCQKSKGFLASQADSNKFLFVHGLQRRVASFISQYPMPFSAFALTSQSSIT